MLVYQRVKSKEVRCTLAKQIHGLFMKSFPRKITRATVNKTPGVPYVSWNTGCFYFGILKFHGLWNNNLHITGAGSIPSPRENPKLMMFAPIMELVITTSGWTLLGPKTLGVPNKWWMLVAPLKDWCLSRNQACDLKTWWDWKIPLENDTNVWSYITFSGVPSPPNWRRTGLFIGELTCFTPKETRWHIHISSKDPVISPTFWKWPPIKGCQLKKNPLPS